MSATGPWKFVVKTPMGEQKIDAVLTEDGTTLTGTMDDGRNPAGPIRDAVVNGDELRWKFPVRKPFSTTLTFVFRRAGDALIGTCKPGMFPAATATGRRASVVEAPPAVRDAAPPAIVAARPSIVGALHGDSDVLIVGAGPVGLTLALLLARKGRSVAVYERWASVYPLPRASAMSHETVRTFQGAGALEALRPYLDLQVRKLSASLYAPDGEVLMTMVFPGVGESGFPPMTGFNQPDADRLLGEMCDAHPLVTVHRGWQAGAIEQRDDDVVVTFDRFDGGLVRDGQPVAARARFVVGCDGANSTVRERMSTDLTDTGFSSSWLVVDTFPLPGVPPFDLFGHVLDPARPATMAPGGPKRQRFEFMIVDGDDLSRIAEEPSVWGLLLRWGVTSDKVTIARRAIYTFRGRWAENWRDRRVLLAGDAAHQMPPFMGQGFNSGIRDAVALAWRLDLVLGGRAEAALLDSYTSERLPHVKQIVESSVGIGQMMCMTDRDAAAERDAGLRMIRDDPEASMPQPEWRLGPGCLMPDDPAAGFVSLQARVERDGEIGLLDDLTGTGRFVLFGDGVDPLAGLSDDARAIWQELDGVVVTIGDDAYRDVDGAYAEWFAKLGARVVLARPDFQVYGATADARAAEALVTKLAEQLRLRTTVTS